MTPSSMPGGKPLVSSRLRSFLERDDDQTGDDSSIHLAEDEFDQLIRRENLQIARFIWVRELDLALFILTNRRVISQALSTYKSLAIASDDEIAIYTTSASGIHWPALDIDLSLRGLLINEVIRAVTVA